MPTVNLKVFYNLLKVINICQVAVFDIHHTATVVAVVTVAYFNINVSAVSSDSPKPILYNFVSIFVVTIVAPAFVLHCQYFYSAKKIKTVAIA